MAIYQFYLAAIPRKGLVRHFGEIPEKLEVEFQKRTAEFVENEIIDEPDYIEFVIHKCWQKANVNPNEIIKEVDKKLDRASWGNDNSSNKWKTQTEEIDKGAVVICPPRNLEK